GNDLAAFLFGHKITVYGNAQDGVGNTMDAGEIVVKGRAGDVLGFSMRGGEIYVRESCGYRTALHLKEYEDKRPVLVVGGTSQDFLGEYMAGGIVILLDLRGQGYNAHFIGTGMHGGAIYLRGTVEPDQVVPTGRFWTVMSPGLWIVFLKQERTRKRS
ncbi:MAG: Glutamate synthase, alpha subunit domain protein, partial [Methanosaeta sp. ASP1-2]